MTNAIHCPVKLYSYRKGRTGLVVAFEIDPAEVPAKLATDPLGTPYMMALAEVDVETGERKVVPADDTNKATVDPAPGSSNPAGRARKSWDEMLPAAQAGMLCADASFQVFLRQHETQKWNAAWHTEPKEKAAEVVRACCGVTSRGDILPRTNAGVCFISLVGRYRAWQREAEVVPA